MYISNYLALIIQRLVLVVFERLHISKQFALVYVRFVHSLPLQRLKGSKKEIKRRASFKILFIKS